jgi:hypothetical protein
VGGHFHDSAAAFAINNIEQDTVGAIELYRRDKTTADVRLKFAYGLVAVAMSKQRDKQNQSVEDYFVAAFRFLVDAVNHATGAVRVITMTELLHRFK